MQKFRQFHSEIFDNYAEANDCIEWWAQQNENFDDPKIEGPDENGKYSISALYEK